MPHMHVFAVIFLNATYLFRRPSLSIITAEFIFPSLHILDSPLSTDSGSLWMSCCDVILSHLRTQKCWGLFLSKKSFILIPHIYVSDLKESIKSSVLVPKLQFSKCQVTSPSHCQKAGYSHHFSSDLLMFVKGKRNVIVMIRPYIQTEAKSLNVRPIEPHKYANF